MALASFVELRTHTAFSFGDGGVSPEALIEAAAAMGYTHLGLTDTADFGGVVRFAWAAKEARIQPIIGAELIVDGHPAAFLARTPEGCHNLAALITRARSGMLGTGDAAGAAGAVARRGRPRVTWADVVERSTGLWALTGPASGALATRIRSGDADAAARQLTVWREVFGPHVVVEVQLHDAGRTEAALAGALIALAGRSGVAWVATNDPRYVTDDGRLVHDVLTALRAGLTLDVAAERGLLSPNGEWRLRSPAEMAARWAGCEEGLAESVRVAEGCEEFSFDWLRPPLPKYSVPPGQTDDSHLRTCVVEGARRRWGTVSDVQNRQLEHELKIIQQLGFAGFFLVMHEVVREAESRKILAQGRGSAANSAVAFCLGITAVDPVANGLMFERFLSDLRVDGKAEAPDIDIDFEHDRREEMLDYMYARYDRAHAAITGMVQTYQAPNATLDGMRALGYPAELALQASKRLHRYDPAAGAVQLATVVGPALGLAMDTPRARTLVRVVAALEGVPRLRSTHPGGFVLSSALLGDYLPIEPTTMGRTVVQFDKDDLDRIGVPKFDFLGLGALSQVRRVFDLIEARTGVRPTMYDLPTNDEPTFRLIARGDTVGTFQIESRAQIASIVHTCPDRMYDIVVQVALIRPGPIQAKFVRPYTRRRRGLEPVEYRHPALEPILQRTQGVPIFQEQAMAIARDLAGYTGGQADELRRTMGHIRKLPRLRSALERLRTRMVARGIPPETATEIVSDLVSFANYGFPESHAWSFALIAYATAYLKTHCPAEFYAALLNSWPMGFYPVSTLVHDAIRRGVEVREPCLRDGEWECTVEDTEEPDRPALRIGWRHVRGIGDVGITALRAARAAGPFTSIADVVARAPLDARMAGALARGGAFHAWEPDRRRAGWEALREAGDRLPLAPARRGRGRFAPRELDRNERIALDYESLGLTAAGHPMERFRAWLRAARVVDSQDLQDRTTCPAGTRVSVGGLVTVRQRPQSAKGTVFLVLEDEWGIANIVVSRAMDATFGETIRTATFLLVTGRVERDGTQVNVVGERCIPLRDATRRPLLHASHDFH
jgi:error-prone DNA polymerase